MTDDIKYDPTDFTITPNGHVRPKGGKFVKGISGNPKGRPKKVKLVDIVSKAEALTEGLKEACNTGEAKKVLEELLKTAENRTEAKQLSKELIQYQVPKKASVETKITDFRRIEFHMIAPDNMAQLETIYKQDPKLVEQLTDADIKKITNGESITIEHEET